MDLELAFVSKLVFEGGKPGYREAVVKGVVIDFFRNDDAKNVFEFIVEYSKSFDGFPTEEMVEGKTGVRLEKTAGDYEFYLDSLLKRELGFKMRRHVENVLENLENRKPGEAYDAYEAGLRDVRDSKIVYAQTANLMDQADAFLEYYEAVKGGKRGVLTNWPTINESTLGFWPEDLVLVVARQGTGKTFALINMADVAWQNGKRVLFITTEMARRSIYQRWVSMHLKLPYFDVRSGRLPDIQERVMYDGIEELKGRDGFYVIGGGFNHSMESVDAAIEECNPDAVYIDGAYLLKVQEGNGRFEKAAGVFDELKRIAKRHSVPVVSTTQFNREVKANKASSLSAEKIAMSDAAGWNADLIFGMVQTDDMRQNRRMIFKPLKFREGTGREFECHWDFELMNFDEVGSSPGS